MSHHFSTLIKNRNQGELKTLQNKLPAQPTSCDNEACQNCYMTYVEVIERLHSWNEDKSMFEYTDQSRYNIMRCVACDKEIVVK